MENCKHFPFSHFETNIKDPQKGKCQTRGIYLRYAINFALKCMHINQSTEHKPKNFTQVVT